MESIKQSIGHGTWCTKTWFGPLTSFKIPMLHSEKNGWHQRSCKLGWVRSVICEFIIKKMLQIYPLTPKVGETHYSKSQIFVHKFNFDKTPTLFFMSFSPVSPLIFLTIFLVKSKLSTAKKSKTTIFSPKKIDNFLGKSKLNFCTKNEDFEQCVKLTKIRIQMYPSTMNTMRNKQFYLNKSKWVKM